MDIKIQHECHGLSLRPEPEDRCAPAPGTQATLPRCGHREPVHPSTPSRKPDPLSQRWDSAAFSPESRRRNPCVWEKQ